LLSHKGRVRLKDSGEGFLSFFLLNLRKEINEPIFYLGEKKQIFNLYENLSSLGYTSLLLERNRRIDVISALKSISENKSLIYLIDRAFLEEKVISEENFSSKVLCLRKSEKNLYNKIISFIEKEGYKKTDFIYEEGDYAIRGGVIDVFSFRPVRIYFDGEEVISIKIIDVEKQRSIKEIEEIEISSLEFKGETIFLNYLNRGVVVHREKGLSFKKDILLSNLEYDFDFKVLFLPSFRGNIDFLFKEIEPFLNQNYDVFVFVQEGKDIPVIKEILESRDIRSSFFNYKKGFFSHSFVSNFFKFLSITDRDILGVFLPKRRIKMLKIREDFEHEDYKEGDYVVHEEYGIGIYRGVRKFEIKGKRVDYFVIEYAKGDKLYVPPEDVSYIKKYTSFSSSLPNVYSLEGSVWRSVKDKLKKEIDDFVKKMLETEAKRKVVRGISFKKKEEEKIFAMEFPYEETVDQKKAIEEVLSLMEKPYPMEHLVCGDVGFGKTEVAMRAAFRAVWNGKQVLLLSPTTILTEQHYINFKERFKNFPISIKALSRLTPQREFSEILKGIETGSVDIIIGTHKILMDKIKFKDLGLLIVDEEHRFGINAKEKIKMRFPYIDVLYLSATPIPRTLAMALEGIKTFSLINTPPSGRKAVRIYIKNYDIELLKEAINRELLRDGQVFYVHNEIDSIEEEKNKIENLFPDVSVDLIHGRLPSKSIEEIMLSFFKGDIKILVSTTIIESGLDIQNVNTLIVNNAHRFGLAQIYQLRGRVGRGDRLAYCFFLYPEGENLKEKAVRRVEAILKYSELGSSFSLAMRDLEIRGAGNFLSKKQHGAVKKIGMEMYLKLLKESISKFTKKKIISEKPVFKVEIEGFTNYYIPENFIDKTEERIFYYRRISEAENEVDLKRIREEIEDRFGKIPDCFNNLFELQYLRILAAKKNIEKISREKDAYILTIKNNRMFFKDKNNLIYFLKNI